MDNHTLAREVAKMIDYYKPDGVFIDGGGVGGGVVDNLRAWKYQVIEVNFGETKNRWISRTVMSTSGRKCMTLCWTGW